MPYLKYLRLQRQPNHLDGRGVVCLSEIKAVTLRYQRHSGVEQKPFHSLYCLVVSCAETIVSETERISGEIVAVFF
jgi:hypothetical protein